jgi:hypothetical protein
MPDIRSLDVDELFRAYLTEKCEFAPVSSQFSRQEICDFIRDTIDKLVGIVQDMSPAQLAYRMPGVPSGPDESGDEAHFDTSEIITHLAYGTAFHWWGIARAMKHARPTFPKPTQEVFITGQQKGMGRGGWSGLSSDELVKLLRGTMDSYLTYVESLPADLSDETKSSIWIWNDMRPHDWLFLSGMHAAMHLNQLEQMRSQPDFPVA